MTMTPGAPPEVRTAWTDRAQGASSAGAGAGQDLLRRVRVLGHPGPRESVRVGMDAQLIEPIGQSPCGSGVTGSPIESSTYHTPTDPGARTTSTAFSARRTPMHGFPVANRTHSVQHPVATSGRPRSDVWLPQLAVQG
jgi:hypothetical protein